MGTPAGSQSSTEQHAGYGRNDFDGWGASRPPVLYAPIGTRRTKYGASPRQFDVRSGHRDRSTIGRRSTARVHGRGGGTANQYLEHRATTTDGHEREADQDVPAVYHRARFHPDREDEPAPRPEDEVALPGVRLRVRPNRRRRRHQFASGRLRVADSFEATVTNSRVRESRERPPGSSSVSSRRAQRWVDVRPRAPARD